MGDHRSGGEGLVVTRRMVSDGEEMFRVVVRRKGFTSNPARSVPGEPYWLFTGEEYDDHYGPYPRIGTAKSVQAHEAYKPAYTAESGKARTDYQWDVVDTWIEKVVEIVWERV